VTSSQSFNNWMSIAECSWIRYHTDTSNFIFNLLLLPIDYQGIRPLADAGRQNLLVCSIFSSARMSSPFLGLFFIFIFILTKDLSWLHIDQPAIFGTMVRSLKSCAYDFLGSGSTSFWGMLTPTRTEHMFLQEMPW
jgi:hypothetical protein